MGLNRTFWPYLLSILCFLTVACQSSLTGRPTEEKPLPAISGPIEGLTPAQTYAGEVLSYLMQVVLGKAGDLRNRHEWAERGLDEKLEYDNIATILEDPTQNKSRLMVLDNQVMGLAKVLYYYDPRLNLFKGLPDQESVYPSPELIALRLLLLKKIHADEKLHWKALQQVESLVRTPEATPPDRSLEQLNLDPQEYRLLQEAVSREPHILKYLQLPEIKEAFTAVGVVETTDSEAETRKGPPGVNLRICDPDQTGLHENRLFRLVILPSLTSDFQWAEAETYPPLGFRPTPFYREMVQTLKTEILEQSRHLFLSEPLNTSRTPPAGTKPSMDQSPWEHIRSRIQICTFGDRPLVIHPGNADRVLGDLCPGADLVIILLGKDVYLSFHLDPKKDQFPACNRIYMDIMDIKRQQISSEVDNIARFIVEKSLLNIQAKVIGPDRR